MMVSYEKRKKNIQEENVCCYNIMWMYDVLLKLHAEIEQTWKIPQESWNHNKFILQKILFNAGILDISESLPGEYTQSQNSGF